MAKAVNDGRLDFAVSFPDDFSEGVDREGTSPVPDLLQGLHFGERTGAGPHPQGPGRIRQAAAEPAPREKKAARRLRGAAAHRRPRCLVRPRKDRAEAGRHVPLLFRHLLFPGRHVSGHRPGGRGKGTGHHGNAAGLAGLAPADRSGQIPGGHRVGHIHGPVLGALAVPGFSPEQGRPRRRFWAAFSS